jgi:hypothetical protein
VEDIARHAIRLAVSTDRVRIYQHVYFFAVPGVTASSIPGRICQETANRRADGFNVFIGEFSLQAQLDNTLAGRQAVYDSQVRAFQQYLSGGTFWTARFDVRLSSSYGSTMTDHR